MSVRDRTVLEINIFISIFYVIAIFDDCRFVEKAPHR